MTYDLFTILAVTCCASFCIMAVMLIIEHRKSMAQYKALALMELSAFQINGCLARAVRDAKIDNTLSETNLVNVHIAIMDTTKAMGARDGIDVVSALGGKESFKAIAWTHAARLRCGSK